MLGRIVAETQNGHRITHQYNAYGNRTAMESSLGAKLQHTYNEWGECVRTEGNVSDVLLKAQRLTNQHNTKELPYYFPLPIIIPLPIIEKRVF